MNEHREKSFESATFGWLVGVILLVGLALIAIPNFIKARSINVANACINNLRQIDAAANQFALEQRKTNGEAIHFPDDLTPYIKLNSSGKISGCPNGGSYRIWRVGQIPKCSLSITDSSHVLP